MKKMLVWASAVILIAGAAVLIYFDTNHFKVHTVQFQTSKIPEGAEIKVLQISDLHNKVFGNRNEPLINAIEQVNADLVVITGDLIDRSTDDLGQVFSLIEHITAAHQHVYFVSGNHEWGNVHRQALLDGLADRDVILLNNRNTQVTIGSITINLAGVDDVSTRHDHIYEAFEGVDQELYTILLSHTPNIADKYGDIPSDLILSGHTHGGQVRLPFIGGLIAPNQGLFPKLDKGTYELGEDRYLYIDSGLGTSVAPIRFLNKSQLSVIQITGR